MRVLLAALFVLIAGSKAQADPYSDMATIQRAFNAVHSYRATMNDPRAKGPILFEYAAPDRYHVKMSHGDEYVIGNSATVIMHGRTITIPFSEGQQMIQNLRTWASNSGDLKSQYTIAYLGMDGKQRTYSFFDHKNPGLKTTLWVGSNNLPTREQSVGTNGTDVVTYSDYNAPISINF